VNPRPTPVHFYWKWLKVILFRSFGPALVICGALTVLGAAIALFRPDLLGELNWLLWAAPLSVFLLFFLLGIFWAPWIMHRERNAGVSKKVEPPKVIVSTRMEGPVQVEQERTTTRMKEAAPVEKRVQEPVGTQQKVEARKIEKPVQVQKGIEAKGEEPFRVEKFSSPVLRQMENYFEEQGEAVAYPRLSEKEEYLARGFEIAYKPGTRQEVWVTYSGGDHIMMLKPE